MIRHFCDKCGRQTSKPKKIRITGIQTDPVILTLAKMEMCENCYESIYSLLDDFVTYKG